MLATGRGTPLVSEMERVLGVRIGRDEFKVRGTADGETPDKVRFVTTIDDVDPNDFLDHVVWAIDPPYVKHGGCVLEDDVLTPNGIRFHTLTFHGDVAGWQRQIEEGAAARNALTAKIVASSFVISDGTVLSISELVVAKAVTPPRRRRPSKRE